MAKTSEKSKIKYKSYSIRMLPQTWDKFKKEKSKHGMSWNMFILKKILKYESSKQRNK